MFEHAKVLQTLVTDIVPLQSFDLMTHDEGDSVGLILLDNYQKQQLPFTIAHHFILNGSIYLPLAQITWT